MNAITALLFINYNPKKKFQETILIICEYSQKTLFFYDTLRKLKQL